MDTQIKSAIIQGLFTIIAALISVRAGRDRNEHGNHDLHQQKVTLLKVFLITILLVIIAFLSSYVYSYIESYLVVKIHYDPFGKYPTTLKTTAWNTSRIATTMCIIGFWIGIIMTRRGKV